MNIKEHGWIIGGLLLCLLVIGVPYWLMPYNDVTLPTAILGPGLLAIAILALVLRSMKKMTFWRIVIISGAVVPAAVFLRVIWEVIAEPTSHNLWPFEIIIAVFVGAIPALAGALFGNLILFLDRKKVKS